MTPLRQQVEADAKKVCKKIPGNLHNITAIEMRPNQFKCERCVVIADALEVYANRCEDVERELSNQTYRGNSIGYIYDKMQAYRDQVLPLADALREFGYDYSSGGSNNVERKNSLLAWVLVEKERILSLTHRLEESEKRCEEADKTKNILVQLHLKKDDEISSLTNRLKEAEKRIEVLEAMERQVMDLTHPNFKELKHKLESAEARIKEFKEKP